MQRPLPRLSSITGVSQALISTVGIDEAVEIMIDQFGWDATFQALTALDGPEGGHATWLAVNALIAEHRT